MKELLGCDVELEVGNLYQEYFNSDDTLLSHGFIHDIENEINEDKQKELRSRVFLSNDVMQLIDLYLDVYFEGFYEKSIEYIKQAFLECDKSGLLREIQINTLNALDSVDVKRVLSKVFK